jgi:hypothetical protein
MSRAKPPTFDEPTRAFVARVVDRWCAVRAA